MQNFLPLISALVAILVLLPMPVSVVHCVSLPLERAFPLTDRVELDQLRARDRLRHGRLLQGSVGTGVIKFPVAGTAETFLGDGLYFTRVKLGSPPTEYYVQIDSGSDVLWVACKSCSNCPRSSGLGVQLNFFNPASSSTAGLVPCTDPVCTSGFKTAATECSTQSNQCSYRIQYGDGSGTSGYYVSEVLYFDMILAHSALANSSAKVVFGCSTFQAGDLATTPKALDGIFGFGKGDLSVLSQLSSRGMAPKVFSHCLRGGNGNGGGILVLGEIVEPGISYTPLIPSQPHYNIDLQSVAINGQLLQIDAANNRGAMVDSGTTLVYLVAEAYDPFVSSITAIVHQSTTPIISEDNQCYLFSSSTAREIFPLVSLNFAGGASMVLKPEEYLYDNGIYNNARMWCIGFQKSELGVTILGDLVLKDKIIVYDLAHQRIGWADYDCSLPVNVSVTPAAGTPTPTPRPRSASSSSRDLLFQNIRTAIMGLLLHIIVL